MTTPTNTFGGFTNTPPPYSTEVAERLAANAQVDVEVRAAPTPDCPEGMVITEMRRGESCLPTKWRRSHRLGQGGQACVFREQAVSGPRTGQVRAVKVFEDSSMYGRLYQEQEFLTTFFLSQPQFQAHFVEASVWFKYDDVVNLALNHYLGDIGSLQLFSRGPVAAGEARAIMAQLLRALEVLHGLQLCHRDVKPANIFVEAMPPHGGWRVKLGDFGIADFFSNTRSQAQAGEAGTPGYQAPDLLQLVPSDETSKFRQTCKADMFAAGCVFFCLLTGTQLFVEPDEEDEEVSARESSGGETDSEEEEEDEEEDEEEEDSDCLMEDSDDASGTIIAQYARGEMDPEWPLDQLSGTGCGRDAKALLRSLLMPRPSKRPTATEALNSRWFSGMDLP